MFATLPLAQPPDYQERHWNFWHVYLPCNVVLDQHFASESRESDPRVRLIMSRSTSRSVQRAKLAGKACPGR